MNWRDEFLKKLYSENSNDLDIQKAFELKRENIPKKIFRYRTINKFSLDEIKSSNVWLSCPESLNDPYECSHEVKVKKIINRIVKDKIASSLFEYFKIFNIDEKKLNELIKREDPIEEVFEFLLLKEKTDKIGSYKRRYEDIFIERLKRIKENFNRLLKDSFKVCSFSEINDSILMWSHYAENHQGICLEYDTSRTEINDIRSRFLFPVIYDDKVIDLTSMYSSNEINNIFRFNLVSIYKSKNWSYEKEWRLVISNGRMKEEGLLEFFPVSKVFLGANISEENRKEIFRICQKKEIPVVNMEIKSDEYKILPN